MICAFCNTEKPKDHKKSTDFGGLINGSVPLCVNCEEKFRDYIIAEMVSEEMRKEARR